MSAASSSRTRCFLVLLQHHQPVRHPPRCPQSLQHRAHPPAQPPSIRNPPRCPLSLRHRVRPPAQLRTVADPCSRSAQAPPASLPIASPRAAHERSVAGPRPVLPAQLRRVERVAQGGSGESATRLCSRSEPPTAMRPQYGQLPSARGPQRRSPAQWPGAICSLPS